jgi:opacity protein-like surface antigen
MRTLVAWLGAVVVVTGVAQATMTGSIDLSALDDVVADRKPPTSVWDDVSIQPVAAVRDDEPRFYLTGLLGQSFATLADPVYGPLLDRGSINRSVLTAGGAAGLAFERDNGRLRVEVEGRGRDDVTARFAQSLPPLFDANFRWAAADGWSAMFNVWRDYSVSEQVDLYLGGGVGGGGYRYSLAGDITVLGAGFGIASNAQIASFAWQAGGGVIWNVSDRVAFDVGYRFFALDSATTTVTGSFGGFPIGSITLPQQFTASELLFGLRIYEPFRRWR